MISAAGTEDVVLLQRWIGICFRTGKYKTNILYRHGYITAIKLKLYTVSKPLKLSMLMFYDLKLVWKTSDWQTFPQLYQRCPSHTCCWRLLHFSNSAILNIFLLDGLDLGSLEVKAPWLYLHLNRNMGCWNIFIALSIIKEKSWLR